MRPQYLFFSRRSCHKNVWEENLCRRSFGKIAPLHSIGGGVVDQGKKMGLEGRSAYAFGIQSEKEKIASDQRRRKGGKINLAFRSSRFPGLCHKISSWKGWGIKAFRVPTCTTLDARALSAGAECLNQSAKKWTHTRGNIHPSDLLQHIFSLSFLQQQQQQLRKTVMQFLTSYAMARFVSPSRTFQFCKQVLCHSKRIDTESESKHPGTFHQPVSVLKNLLFLFHGIGWATNLPTSTTFFNI